MVLFFPVDKTNWYKSNSGERREKQLLLNIIFVTVDLIIVFHNKLFHQVTQILQTMSATYLCLIFFALILTNCEGYKILVIIPIPVRSHSNLGAGVVRHLLKDGHEVTFISAFPYKPTHPSLRMIDISANLKGIPDDLYSIPVIMHKQFEDYDYLFSTMIEITKMAFLNDKVQKLLNDPGEQFDVVIAEWLLTELPAGLAAVYNCPLIWISSLDIHWAILNLIDQPSSPAFTAHLMSTAIPPFTFWERISELYAQLKVLYWRYMYFDKLEKQQYEDLLAPLIIKRGRQPPSYYDLQFNASLVLANSHISLGQAISVPHNYIPVGGYHVADVQPLPEELQNIMDNAKNGVIYFSMGSNLKSKDIPKAIKDSIIKVFSELNQTVIWKYEENLLNVPKNVHVIKWAPQQSILSHHNTKLFITHGGLLSTIESIHFAVPIIGIPVFGDQHMNVDKAVNKGIARRVDLTNKIADELKLAITELITNPRYKEKVKELSSIYHDRPVPPGKEIRHWVKHVIRTHGAPHLRSPALHVPFYQKLYLDLLAIIVLFVLVIKKIGKYLYNLRYCAKMENNKKNK